MPVQPKFLLRRRIEKLEALRHGERVAERDMNHAAVAQALSELTDGELEMIEQMHQTDLPLEQNRQVQTTVRKYARRVAELSVGQPVGSNLTVIR